MAKQMMRACPVRTCTIKTICPHGKCHEYDGDHCDIIDDCAIPVCPKCQPVKGAKK